MTPEEIITTIIKDQGFVLVGFLGRQDALLGDWIKPWLDKGFQADMAWIEKNQGIRQDPCSIEEKGQSIITMAYPYNTEAPAGWEKDHLISNYAWGEDYHKVLKKKLKLAMAQIQEQIPEFQGRAFTDSAPLPEKILAAKSGLGWIGKNSLLINREYGSYLFLAEIVCNLPLTSTPPGKDYCGSCTRCLQACPTVAINEQKEVDSRLCVSYLTIEKHGEFTEKEEKALDSQLFGCDICQQVCPWNNKAPVMEDSPFACFPRWADLDLENISTMTDEQFNQLKEKSPVKRTKVEGFRRNAQAVLHNRISD